MSEMERVPVAGIKPDALCIVCGCTQARACAGGCGWTVLNLTLQRGVCSRCSGPLLHAFVEKFQDGIWPFTDAGWWTMHRLLEMTRERRKEIDRG